LARAVVNSGSASGHAARNHQDRQDHQAAAGQSDFCGSSTPTAPWWSWCPWRSWCWKL